MTAKHIFEHVKPGMIKFVLIGLSPDSFHYDNSKDFVNQKNLQYQFALNFGEENFLQNLFSEDAKNIFTTPAAQADLNFDAIKKEFNREFSAKSIADWDNDSRPLTNDIVEENIRILKDYIALCLENGAKPVGVVFPFAPAVRKNYNQKLLAIFREIIRRIKVTQDFIFIDMFEFNLNYHCFGGMTHLNWLGTSFVDKFLAMKLGIKNLIPAESFCNMTYDYFYRLSFVAPKDEYNELMKRVFKSSAEMISRKDKIKIGFVLYDSSMWCGDDLHNIFASNKKFEITVFLCLRMDKSETELSKKDFLHGVKQFKQRGLNVIAVTNQNSLIPAQDIFIFLTPYFEVLPFAFRPENLKTKTLMIYVPYGFSVSSWNLFNYLIVCTAWKIFFSSDFIREIYDKNCNVGVPRGFFSGYSRLDIFFKKGAKFHFKWKSARRNAKRIIWAPHWSINEGVNQATFQWNYQFMYDFAKNHPKISWIVKPHPNLFFSAVSEKVFPSDAAFKEYLQKWDKLPNAQVYTGGYYQDIFATSDGMIHDSSSFIAEYQYVDKPMIYLTREGIKFNELGNEVLKTAYLVDGKDLNGIAAMIQRVFIEGDDYKAAERKAVFDKYLNYPKMNGMLASEFIYKSIADELK